MKTIVTKDGRKIRRVSRWISIRHAYNVTKRHSLWYYATDGNGYRNGSEKFDPSSETYLDYFVWNGRKWAIDQFYRLDYPIMWEEDSKLNFIGGYDSENYYNPILIEIDEYGEYVRVYEEE